MHTAAVVLAAVAALCLVWAIIEQAAREARRSLPARREEFDLECWLDAPSPHECRHEWAHRPGERGCVCRNCGLWVEHAAQMISYGVPAHVMRYRRG